MSGITSSEESLAGFRERLAKRHATHADVDTSPGPIVVDRERRPAGRNFFRALGDITADLALTKDQVKDNLRKLAGKSMTALQMGFVSFHHRAAALGIPETEMAAVEELAYLHLSRGCTACESPIEKTMLAAMLTYHWGHEFLSLPPLIHLPKEEDFLPRGDLVIVPQFAFAKYRVDFLIVAELNGRKEFVAVECDGEEFHQDAMRDRTRDAYFQSWGIPVVRVTGSLISGTPDRAVALVEAAIHNRAS